MVDGKHESQLVADLGKQRGSKKALAELGFVTQSMISKYINGKAKMPVDMASKAVQVTQSWQLALTSARKYFGAISYLHDHRLQDNDALAALVTAHKEERDRSEIEESALEAMRLKPECRSAEQQRLIEQYFKEQAEEIGSELNERYNLAQYAAVNVAPIDSSYNKHFGG